VKALTRYVTVVCVLIFLPSAAAAKTYRYTDDKGVVHLTNDKDTIPGEYRKGTVALKEDKRVDGYTPPPGSMPEEEGREGEEGEQAKGERTDWVIKEEPGVLKKTERFVDRNVKYILGLTSDVRVLLGMAALAPVVVILLSFLLFKRKAVRFLFVLLVLGCVYVALYSLYFRNVMEKGGDPMKETEDARSDLEEHNKAISEVLK
jgi:hypothetical protein